MNNKTLILTQPLGLNYGGILQAYSLQQFLQINSCQVEILNWSIASPNYRWLFSYVKRLFLKKVFKRNMSSYPNSYPPLKYFNAITYHTRKFIVKHLKLTHFKYEKKDDFSTRNELFNYDVYIAGSDQVWTCNKPNSYVKKCMFDFLKIKNNIIRISFAASFGKDKFCSEPKFVLECKQLLQKFDAVSVREDSGVSLCKNLFGIDAVHVIDPTMFFDANHYVKLSKERNDYSNNGECFTYILDKSEEKQRIINKICSMFNLKSFNVMPKSKFADVGPRYVNDCVLPPVEQWLDGFNKAKFIITDSFHGCVFSIIFKKPFIVIGNESRGMARFDSLLRMFKLENRLIHSEKDLTEEVLNSEIDYEAVHEKLVKERQKAVTFLKSAIESKK